MKIKLNIDAQNSTLKNIGTFIGVPKNIIMQHIIKHTVTRIGNPSKNLFIITQTHPHNLIHLDLLH